MKKVLLGATHSVIEPLGLLHLSTIARQEGWEPRIVMAKNGFMEFDKAVKEFKPDITGMTVYTGNHKAVFNYLDILRKSNPGMKVAVGGPHSSYFPRESLKHANYVVLSEGFGSFRRILRGEAKEGVVPLIDREAFPRSDREDFYRTHKEYDDSPIKSVIASTGCPYACSYCYNSSTIGSINLEGIVNPTQRKAMDNVLGHTGRLFPKSLRPVDDVIKEVEDIKRISPQTQMIYFQDDVFGANSEWLEEFSKKYKRIKMPFHAQMRFENANPLVMECRDRVDRLRDAGCTGLTLAIESSSPIIRREVLNRNMSEELMFNVMDYLGRHGYKVRTEQMLGLPYGATSMETKVNLEADLETLELNVRLKKETNLPTMAWASIFAPYRGTKIGNYCMEHGFYSGGNNDVPETFFQRSVLRFPTRWIGPSLSKVQDYAWMKEEELEKYRDDMQMLRDLFSYFSMVLEGHKLARKFINQKDRTFMGLSRETRRHLYDDVLYDIK